ncbi:MAG: hypothetical protein V3V06_05700, partial [Dehalococcoidia bacterium]
MERMIHLGVDLSFTHTEGAWRNPGSWVSYPYYTHPRMWEDAARIAERGKVDMIFFGDGVGIPDSWQDSIAGTVKWGVESPRHDEPARAHHVACDGTCGLLRHLFAHLHASLL